MHTHTAKMFLSVKPGNDGKVEAYTTYMHTHTAKMFLPVKPGND